MTYEQAIEQAHAKGLKVVQTFERDDAHMTNAISGGRMKRWQANVRHATEHKGYEVGFGDTSAAALAAAVKKAPDYSVTAAEADEMEDLLG